MSNTYDVGNIVGSDSMNSKEREFFGRYGNALEQQADLIARQHGLEAEEQEKTLGALLRDLEGRKNEYVVQGALLHCSKGTCNRQTLMYKGKELESRPLQREAYTRIQVPEDREARINELIPARVDDCKGGLRDIRDGEVNIHGFGNCSDIIGKVALEDLLARTELTDREAEVREAIEAGKGTCHCLMKLNESWENLSLAGEYLTGYFDFSPDLIEYERDRCSPSYLRFNGKEGINMMSMLFCSFGGGIITAQESGQIPKGAYMVELWAKNVDDIAQWYVDNVRTYCHMTQAEIKVYGESTARGRKSYKCDLEGNLKDHTVYDDCSGFLWACLYQAGYFDEYVTVFRSKEYLSPGGLAVAKMEEAGFKWYNSSELSADELETGDILVRNGHVEIFYDFDGNGVELAWTWGSVYDMEPAIKKKTTKNNILTQYMGIWRLDNEIQ